jgi:hypothetical protein
MLKTSQRQISQWDAYPRYAEPRLTQFTIGSEKSRGQICGRPVNSEDDGHKQACAAESCEHFQSFGFDVCACGQPVKRLNQCSHLRSPSSNGATIMAVIRFPPMPSI